MNIEQIKRKDYTVSQYATKNDLYADMKDDIDVLISEVEKLYKDFTEACNDACEAATKTIQQK